MRSRNVWPPSVGLRSIYALRASKITEQGVSVAHWLCRVDRQSLANARVLRAKSPGASVGNGYLKRRSLSVVHMLVGVGVGGCT